MKSLYHPIVLVGIIILTGSSLASGSWDGTVLLWDVAE